MTKVDELIDKVQELLERLKTKSRDSDKHEYRNSMTVSGSRSLKYEVKKNIWIGDERSIHYTERWDDDEGRSMDYEAVQKNIDKELNDFEKHFNKRYGYGASNLHR